MIVVILTLSLSSANAQDKSQLETINELVDIVDAGILSGDRDIANDTVSHFMLRGRGAKVEMVNLLKNEWDISNIDYVNQAFIRRCQDNLFPITEEKLELIKTHISKFAAFKAAVNSSCPPSEELGELIALQLNRGIKLAKRVSYPDDEIREKAKGHISTILSTVQERLISLCNDDPKLTVAIQSEVENFMEGMMWRCDSPFFAVGKVEMKDEEFQYIFSESLPRLEKLSLNFLAIPEHFEDAPDEIRNSIIGNRVKKCVDLVYAPYHRFYAIKLRPFPTKEEAQEMESLFEAIKKKKGADDREKYNSGRN